MIRSELRTLHSHAGNDIVASFFYPDGEPRACVLIVPAMGVAQKFYSPLALWLASQDFLVATFDYVGIGLSRRSELRALEVNIIDWARFDCEAMIRAITNEASAKPLNWLGHSLGGQIMALVPSCARVTKAVTIASGSGYWQDSPPGLKWRAWWMWYVAVPVATRIWGYFPGKRLRKVGDLPRGVIEQWRRWCLDPHYNVGVEGPGIQAQFDAVKAPITSISFIDDEFMSLKNTESLHAFYRNAPRTMQRFSPQQTGAARIGHFGFFNARFQESLWRAHLLPELACAQERRRML